MAYLWVGIAGIIGTWLRYVLSLWVQEWSLQTLFPVGTLAVNLIGCFVLGMFSAWVLDKPRISPRVRTMMTTGLIGSFTTFSTFSVENVDLLRQGYVTMSMAYIGLSIVGGLCFIWLGLKVVSLRKETIQHD